MPPIADPFASFLDSAGNPVLVPQGKAPSGVPYYQSEGIDPATGRTPSGDANNPFKGFVGPQGGGFGAKDAAGYLSILGGAPGQYDALATRLASDPALKAQWQGILQNDPAAITAAASGSDPDLAKIGADYASRLPPAPAADGSPSATPESIAASMAQMQEGGGSALPAKQTYDEFAGRNDSPTAASHVITPASEDAFMATQANDPTDPFAQFTPQIPAPGAVQNATQINPAVAAAPEQPVFSGTEMSGADNSGATPFGGDFANLMAAPPQSDGPLDGGGSKPTPDQTALDGASFAPGGVITESSPFAASPFGQSAASGVGGGGGFGGASRGAMFRPIGNTRRPTGMFPGMKPFMRPVKRNTVAGQAGPGNTGNTGMASY